MDEETDYKGQAVTFALGERANDNYFALVWHDPSSLEIRSTSELMRFFEDIRADNEGKWVKFCNLNGGFESDRPADIVEYLTSDLEHSVLEWDGFLSIRAIALKW